MRLLALSGALLAGVFLSSRLGLGGALLVALALSPVLLLFVRRNQVLLWGGLCLLAFVLGAFRFQTSQPAMDEGALSFYNEKGPLEVLGVVEDDPEPGDASVPLRLAAREVLSGGERRSVEGRVLVFARLGYPGYGYGDLLRVEGRLEAPPRFEDFDYSRYLAGQGVYSTMLYPEVEKLATGQGFLPLEWVHRLRKELAGSLARALPEPQASLAQGILLGLRKGIPQDVSDAFARTGTTHILAISGHNIGVVAGMVSVLGVWLFGRRRGRYLVLALAVVWGYALIAGAGPPVLRAAIMASLVTLASYLGRQSSSLPSLAFAAAFLSVLDPQMLWDVSFQLSFLAMAGLILATPTFEGWMGAMSGRGYSALGSVRWGIIASLAASLGAVLATLPIIAFNFHRISSVSLPATLVALPALPAIIVTGALAGVAGLLTSPPLAQALGWVAWPFVSYLLGVVELFAWLPFASWEVGGVSEAMVWGYYGLALGLLWLTRGGLQGLRRRREWVPAVVGGNLGLWTIGLLALVAVTVWMLALTEPDRRLNVSFLDVGQGDAIFIQTPSGRQVLVDGGPSRQAIATALGKRMPFWDRSIDLVVLTHPQEDHLAGLVEVLSRYEVGRVLEGGLAGDSSSYKEWQAILTEKRIPRVEAAAGQLVDLGDGVALEVLHPHSAGKGSAAGDGNNASVVLRLAAGQVSFLLTGDIELEAEEELLGQGAELKSTILKVAHHGSKTSTSPRFLQAVDPRAAVISVGAENTFGHPTAETMERLAATRVYRTDQQGTIEVISDGHQAWIRTER